METLDRKKIGMNIKVRRMQKLISQTAKNILGCTIDELLCLEDENKPRKKRVRVIRYLD